MAARFIVPEDELIDNPRKRCPCMLVLDTSGSMSGAPIRELNQRVKEFVRELQADKLAGASVELGIITFDSTVTERLDFTLVEKVEAPVLSASGSTEMGPGVSVAVKRLRGRRQQYRASGARSYVPWLVLMTDGGPNDDWQQAAQELKSLGEQKKLIVFGIGIGDGCDFDTLGKFCPAGRPPIRLTGLNFDALFHFSSKSTEQVVTGAAAGGGFGLAIGARDSNFAAAPAKKEPPRTDLGEDPDDW